MSLGNIAENTKHYKRLLYNMPVRHTLTMVDMESGEFEEKLLRLVDVTEITNFFILAR